jgi:myo-inositol 2-dehydrogenase / D-chiro-inositol 1-dehydrogenase
MKHWRIGLVGCGWISEVYVKALREVPGAEAVACCASSLESARAFAERLGVPHACSDWRELVSRDDVDVVTVGVPNQLHHAVAIAALEAGKHVIIEKPLALTLEECADIVETSRRTGKGVGYAENLCFAPKYTKAKALLDAGRVGDVRFIKQVEKHDGPGTSWFYDADLAGGGALFDMGCHSIEFARWLIGKPAVKAVWATMDTWIHRASACELEDHVVVHLEFEGGVTALLESGWTLKGGMASTSEVQGTGGVLHASLFLEGAGMRLFSESAEEPGWQNVDADWNRQNGYPQELEHFLDCFDRGVQPSESAEDGLAVLEIMLAAYASAGSGKRIELPFRPTNVLRPVDLWKSPPADLS